MTYPIFCIVFVVGFWLLGLYHYWSHGNGYEDTEVITHTLNTKFIIYTLSFSRLRIREDIEKNLDNQSKLHSKYTNKMFINPFEIKRNMKKIFRISDLFKVYLKVNSS